MKIDFRPLWILTSFTGFIRDYFRALYRGLCEGQIQKKTFFFGFRKFCLRVFGVRTNVVKGLVWSQKTSQNAGITPVGILKKIPMLLNIHNMTVPPQNPENEQNPLI